MIKKTFLTLTILLSYTSCTKKDLSTDNQSTLKILNQVSSPLAHFDPQLATSLASQMQIAKVYEPLMETHPFDPPYEILPNLAQAPPTISNNGITYTFKIRKGVSYHPLSLF